jgi:ribosomal protein S18 acetylase RimI-like enzyme
VVQLVPMSQGEFDAFIEWSICDYVAEMVKAGIWDPVQAEEKCRQETRETLPQGSSTPDHYFYTIRDDQTDMAVGVLWLGVLRKQVVPIAYINDLFIEEKHRRRGYATQAMLAAEEKARQLGFSGIGLHVFGHNKPAIALYQKLGYEATSIQMRKQL